MDHSQRAVNAAASAASSSSGSLPVSATLSSSSSSSLISSSSSLSSSPFSLPSPQLWNVVHAPPAALSHGLFAAAARRAQCLSHHLHRLPLAAVFALQAASPSALLPSLSSSTVPLPSSKSSLKRRAPSSFSDSDQQSSSLSSSAAAAHPSVAVNGAASAPPSAAAAVGATSASASAPSVFAHAGAWEWTELAADGCILHPFLYAHAHPTFYM
jgi:hypothetical protein